MAQEEKKKRKGKRRRQSKNSSLPLELTREILSRLPEKSIVRFRCVSKLWSSIITDPYFINLFNTRCPRPTLLLCLSKGDDLFVSSIQQHTLNSNKAYSSPLPIERYHMKVPGYGFHHLTESVHGLICVESSPNPLVWNPSMRSFLPLPNPNPNNHKSWEKTIFFLGYDPMQGKHKVVCVRHKKVSYVCRVLTLGSAQESWRRVKTYHKHRVGYNSYGRCINGVIYYIARTCKLFGFSFVIMSFDVRSEKFDMVELPFRIYNGVLINYEERLACIDNDGRLWILEDVEKNKWTKLWRSQDFLSSFHRSLRTEIKLRGVTPAGEFIYVPDTFHKSYYILFFDPVRNSSRRFEFKGIADGGGESWPSHMVGIGTDAPHPFHAIPNHIQSLMPL